LRLWLAKDVVQDKYKRARVGALGSRWAQPFWQLLLSPRAGLSY
jgi:hypothetical protein